MNGRLLNSKSETNLKLPLFFIIFGLCAFIVSQYIFFMNSEHLINGVFRSPQILMGAHLLLLGFLIMIIMGAMYQLVPVVFLTSIWSEKLGFIQLVITGLGVIIFSVLLGFRTNQAVLGAFIVLIGIFLFFLQMAMTLTKHHQKNTLTLFVGSALLCFFLTIIAGMALAWTIAYDSSISYTAILQSHILLGVAGWFTLLIFGFSYKLVPMFSLSHGFSMRWAKMCFCSYIFGLTSFICYFWISISSLKVLGLLFLFIGFTLFALDMWEIVKKRLKKRLDLPFRFALIAIGFGWLIHLIALSIEIVSMIDYQTWAWLTFCYITSWVMLSILGYLYKIVPFLWWTYKYSKLVGKQAVPTLKEMINDNLGLTIFTIFMISTLGITLSGILQVYILFLIFQGLLFICSLLYGFSIVKVLTK